MAVKATRPRTPKVQNKVCWNSPRSGESDWALGWLANADAITEAKAEADSFTLGPADSSATVTTFDVTRSCPNFFSSLTPVQRLMASM